MPPSPPETTRTVTVSVTVLTDRPQQEILYAVTEASRALPVVGAHVSTYDPNDDPEAYLVIKPGTGLLAAYIDDPDRAEQHAARTGGVVASLSITDDYRPQDPS